MCCYVAALQSTPLRCGELLDLKVIVIGLTHVRGRGPVCCVFDGEGPYSRFFGLLTRFSRIRALGYFGVTFSKIRFVKI